MVKKPKTWPLVLAYLVAGSLAVWGWTSFCQSERDNARLFFQWEVERLADGLIRAHHAGALTTASMPENLLGLGIYNPMGLPQALYGDVDPSFSLEDTWDGRPTLNPLGNSTFEFLRALEIRPGLFTHRPGFLPPLEGFLYLKFQDSTLNSKLGFWEILGLLGSLGFLGILGLLLAVQLRLRHYRASALENHELAQYGQASRILAHEIKNPLASVLLQAKILQPAAPESSRVITEEVQRINHLMAKMKDFLTQSGGQPETLDLWEAVKSHLDRFDPPPALVPAENPGIKIKMDPQHFRSVVENLVKNALESGENPRCEVHLSRHRNQAHLEVLDRGSGLAPEIRTKLFQPFQTTKTQGTGLGLNLCRRWVEAAGGRIQLQDRSGGGSRALVTWKEVHP